MVHPLTALSVQPRFEMDNWVSLAFWWYQTLNDGQSSQWFHVILNRKEKGVDPEAFHRWEAMGITFPHFQYWLELITEDGANHCSTVAPILAFTICPEGFHVGWYWRVLRDQGAQKWMHHAYPGFTESHQQAQSMPSQYWSLGLEWIQIIHFLQTITATDFWSPSQQLFS